MAITSFAGIFSRWFVVGFFLPIFFACVAFDQMTHGALIPAENRSGGTRMLIYGGVAVLIGLLLTALYSSVLMIVSGRLLLPAKLASRRRNTWIKKRNWYRYEHDKLQEESHRDHHVRVKRLKEAYDRLPSDDKWMEPTKFGNALVIGGERTEKRLGLDLLFLWPCVATMLPEDQRELESQARTDTAFAVNGMLSAIILVVVALLSVVSGAHWSYRPAVIAGGTLVAVLLYFQACDTALRWVAETQYALVVTHWLDVCEKLRITCPKENDEQDRRRAVEAVRAALNPAAVAEAPTYQAVRPGLRGWLTRKWRLDRGRTADGFRHVRS